MIPKGDFTKQKYIVGRITSKDEEDDNNTKTFNFKLPFDNFVGLENLMTNNPMIPAQYIANKPIDGMKNDLADTAFLTQLGSTNSVNTQKITEAETKLINLDVNLLTLKEILKEHQQARAGSTLNAYAYNNNQTFLQALIEEVKSLAKIEDSQFDLHALDTFWNWYTDKFNTFCLIPYDDYNDIWTTARAEHDKQYAISENLYEQAVEKARKDIDDLFDDTIYTDSNHNHIWSWTRSSTNPVIETKLGIGIDFKTLLGNYRPLYGDYGLRILISGKTKQSEEKNSEQVTEEVYLKTSDMYGNVYAFYEPYTQQKIFDLSHFICLNRIDIFFWQDHNFVDYTGKYIPYAMANGDDMPANILLSNLDVKLGLTTDECQTDRVFLYTYDDVYFGYDALAEKEAYNEYLAEHEGLVNDSSLTEAQRQLQIEELKQQRIAAGDKWLDTSRTLNFAWVHLTDKGPVLVNHVDYWPADNKNDTAALQYWIDNGGAQIQWYHWEYNCNQNTELLEERQGGASWKYLSEFNPLATRMNDQGQTIDYKASQFSIQVTPDASKAREQWKAIVSVGNVPFSTDPIVFTNVDKDVETETFDTLNEVVFRILHEEFNDQANIYNIVEDNQLRDFYVYDINGRAIQNENGRRYSDLDYYVQVWIRNNDTGEYLPMTYDPEEGLVEVEFNWPSSMSMLRDWSEVETADLQNAVLAPLLNGASEYYNQRIRDITRKFKIEEYWHANKNNNTISATVKRKGKVYHPTIQFNFGESSSAGTDYVLTLSQIQPAGSMIVKDQLFAIEANVRQKNAVKDPNSKYVFSWQLLSPTGVTQSSEASYQEGQNPQWTIDNSNGFIGNVLRGVVRNDNPPIFKVTVTNAANYPLTQTTGFRLATHPDIATDYVVNSCAERVEFKSDGTVPISYYGTFSVQKMFDDGAVESVYPTWEITQQYNNGNDWTVLDKPQYFGLKEAVTASKSLDTNPNTIVYAYTAPGDTLPDLNQPFSATSLTNYAGYHYSELKQYIETVYNDTVTTAIENNAVNLSQIEEDAALLRTTRLNDLDLVAVKLVPGFITYQFDPYVKNDASLPWIWEDALEQHYYTTIWFEIPSVGKFIQAVPFTRNLYSSTLLNSWDGKLTVDENENAILTQMISAGTKSNIDNTFTGVVMGNWSGVSDTSLDIPGLYGLEDGGQVFGFKTDGSGFIGKAGRGRIVFDGKQSLISNVDRTSYINLDPIVYHYDGNNIVFDNYQGYSQYFLYSETNKSSTASLEGEDDLEESTYWASKYMNDQLKDYFIVDPNNGVLTSGGVIARYGKIGNWMISSSGLYQKYTGSSTITENRYMYLGYCGVKDTDVNNIKAAYAPQIQSLNVRKELSIKDIESRFLSQEFNVVGSYYKNIYILDPMHYFNCGWPYYSLIQAIQTTLDNLTANDTLETNRSLLIKNLEHYIELEKRSGYHWHYNPTTFEKTGSSQFTGDTYVFNLFMNGMYIQNPTVSAEILQQVTDNNEYPDGYSKIITVDSNVISANKIIPYSQETFYGTQWSNDYNTIWGSPVASIATFDFANLSTFSIEHMQQVLAVATGLYNYFYDAYMRQIQAGIDAGLAELREAQYIEYQKRKAQLQEQKELALQKLDKQYNDLFKVINDAINKQIKKLYDNDKNRYAIYAGYNSPYAAGGVDPLFSVNWRGYMTARAGKIGSSSPWFITDYGLTQTNNFGTIFLGNPEAPADKTQWVDLGTDVDSLQLLPNHNEANSPLVLGASDDSAATRGKFAIYAGNKGYIWSYNTQKQKYERNPEDSPSIKFGVRMDGTLYAITGNIGGWNLTQNMLYAGSPEGNGDFLVLDANRGVINLNNAVILQKDGVVTLGTMVSDGNGGLVSSGTINIAGVIFKGQNSGKVNFDVPTYTLSVNDGTAEISSDTTYRFWGRSTSGTGTALGAATINAGKASSTIAAKEINFTAVLNINDGAEISNGVVIGFGTEATESKKAVAIYPSVESALTNSVLGTDKHRWDIVGDYVTCNTLDVTQGNISALNMFMGTDSQLVATQKWVRDQLSDVYAAIKAAANGASVAGMRGYNGAVNLANSLNKMIDAIVTFLQGKYFVDTYADTETGSIAWDYTTSSFPRLMLRVKQITKAEDGVSVYISDSTDPSTDIEGALSTLGLSSEDTTITSCYIIAPAVKRLNTITGAYAKDSIQTGLVKEFSAAEDNRNTATVSAKTVDSNTNLVTVPLSLFMDHSDGDQYVKFSINLNHCHQPTIEWDDTNGKIKITINNANFQKTSLTTDDDRSTLTISTTSWFKARGIGTLYGKNSSGNDTAVAARVATSTQPSQITSTKIYGTYNSEASTAAISIPLTLKALDTTTVLIEGNLKVDASEAYLKGWNDAAQALRWYKSGDSVYIDRPRYYGSQVPTTFGYRTTVKKIASIDSKLSTSYDSTAADYEYKTLTASCSGTISNVYAGSSYSSGDYDYWNGSNWVSTSGQHDFYADASYSDSASVSAYALAYLKIESDD